ncbi:MAG: site-specific integrase [Oscillospiraceae bacterium]|nr:site-specific integrase [Oscillospiraceae bacterium]
MPYRSITSKRSVCGRGSIRKRTYKRKDGSPRVYWEARFSDGVDPKTGKPIQRTITGSTQKEVREKLNKALCQQDEMTYVPPSNLTVAQWLETWTKDYLLGVKESTASLYRQSIRLYIVPYVGAVKLDKLTTTMVQRFYNELVRPTNPNRSPISAKSVKNVHGIFHRALQQAVRIGMLRINPTDGCVLPRIVRKEIRPLTSEQIAAFLKLLPGHPHEYLYQVALFTGMREGELLGLPWDCVDFEHGTILVKQQLNGASIKSGKTKIVPPKNDKMRIIPMAPTVAELLRKHKQKQDEMRTLLGDKWTETGLVFTGPFGGYLSHRTVYDCFKRLVVKIGAPEARVHDLRHTYAVVCLESGVDIKTLQENLGHATVTFTLDVYGHVSQKMRQQSAEKLEIFIRSVNAKAGRTEAEQGAAPPPIRIAGLPAATVPA